MEPHRTVRSHSIRVTTRRDPDGAITRTTTRLHPAWRAVGRAIALLMWFDWPLTIGSHRDGRPSAADWVLFAVWVPVTVAAAWALRRRSSG